VLDDAASLAAGQTRCRGDHELALTNTTSWH
jgi:hypothetical protein